MMLIWANIAYAVGPNAVVYAPGCDTNTLLPNDDGSTDVVALPFPLKFFGPVYNSVYVNNNGNITFRLLLQTTPLFRSSAHHV